ncbi:MAG: FAD-dependent oxidoreductase, partial [Hymenobacter sp.]
MNATTRSYHTEILLIGAGAAGLFAARALAQAGRQVLLVEARDRVGGRVHTLTPPGFVHPLEAGAEFLHGAAPLSRALLAETGTAHQDTTGQTYVVQSGEVLADNTFFALLPQLLAKIQTLTHDLPLAAFLAQEFAGPENAALRATATQFAEGYDAADPQRASTQALGAE